MCPFSPQTLFCLEFSFIVIQSHFFIWKKQLLRLRTFNNCWARAQMRRAKSKWSPLVSKLFFIIYFTWNLFLKFSYRLTALNLYCSRNSSCNPSPNWHTGTQLKLKTFFSFALFYNDCIRGHTSCYCLLQSSPFTMHSTCPPTQQHHVLLTSFAQEQHFIKWSPQPI